MKLIVKQKFCASSWLITEMHGQQNVKTIFIVIIIILIVNRVIIKSTAFKFSRQFRSSFWSL